MILDALRAAAAIGRSQIIVPEQPWRLPQAVMSARRWGQNLTGAVAASTARYPTVVAVDDAEGTLTYRELWRRTNALARAWQLDGVGPDSTVGILALNGRRFVEAALAAEKLGANTVFLNTAAAAPQVAAVVASEGVTIVIHDGVAGHLVAGGGIPTYGPDTCDAQIESSSNKDLDPPARPGRVVILTSGTTGSPKGAVRSNRGGLVPLGALLQRIPARARSRIVIAPPLFHAWGLSWLALGLGSSSTVVLRPQFDPLETLQLIADRKADTFVTVPVMLQRILALDGEAFVENDTSALRMIVCSGSALGASVAMRTIERFGPLLYNVYGSTEVAVATIATPTDLKVSPGTTGRPALGVDVKVLDDHGQPVRQGETGRIFVGSGLRFEGYTDGGSKEERNGLLSSGDVGLFDSAGRLTVLGRDDDMIVSGGENVYPSEVEELLAAHPAISEVTVIGVPDPEFGQRLVAYVVRARKSRITAAQVKAHVRENLARFKVPREVVFLAELPRTASGKVIRRQLP